jgi:hypothetical protein
LLTDLAHKNMAKIYCGNVVTFINSLACTATTCCSITIGQR